MSIALDSAAALCWPLESGSTEVEEMAEVAEVEEVAETAVLEDGVPGAVFAS